MNKVSKNVEKGAVGGLIACTAQVGAYMTMKLIGTVIPSSYTGETVVALTGAYAAILAAAYNYIRHIKILNKDINNASPTV